MTKTTVRSIVLVTTIFGGLSGEPPLLDDGAAGVSDSIRHLQEHPESSSSIDERIWFEATAKSNVPLIRAFLNERVIFGDLPPDFESKKWWNRAIELQPAALAVALSEASTEYVVWDIGQWPESLNSAKPTYRLALVEAMFESYSASMARVDSLRAEVSAFTSVNRFPPGGLPAHTDPAWIKDPKLRAEYQARLDEIQRQNSVEQELDRTQNAAGELSHYAGERMKLLYRNAKSEEVQKLADLIVDRHWTGNDLCHEIIADWSELVSCVANAQKEP